MERLRGKERSQIVQGTLVIFGTFGIIVPLAVMVLPSTGKFPPPRPLIQESPSGNFPRPPKSQLTLYLRGIHELENVPKFSPNRLQLKHISATIFMWQKRAAMSDDEAEKIINLINKQLTRPQRVWLRDWLVGFSGYNPTPPAFDDKQGLAIQVFRATYNPFAPPDKHKMFGVLPKDMQERYQIRYAERMAILKAWLAASSP